MQSINASKEKRFFEYLLELTKLTSKVIRDYENFAEFWNLSDLEDITGCFVGDELNDTERFLEIHNPHITREESTPPKPNQHIKKWLKFDVKNEYLYPDYHRKKTHTNELNEEQYEVFENDHERVESYEAYKNSWTEWSTHLKEKRRQADLYEKFFNLVSRFEREGESLEFVLGKGILTWNHPDRKIGLIRSPIIIQKLELELDAIKGLIIAKRVDEINYVDREMLSGVSLPNKSNVDAILNSISNTNSHDDTTDLLTQLAYTIDANGAYVDSYEKITIIDTPIIYDQSVLLLRVKNTRVIRDDLINIIDRIDSDTFETNEAIQSILGIDVETTNEKGNPSNRTDNKLTKNGLFFPLDSNEQQKEIVNRIDRSYGVTVQGPPGTGKTHTIANLVSHFLAEGKRILITSQKESPLRVLKSKIPKEIQSLCVPVLGGGRDSLQEIEKSINTISEKLGELDPKILSVNINSNLKELDESKRKEALLINKLKRYTEKEGSVLNYKDEELFKYDVAKHLSEAEVKYEWILDDLSMESAFPLNELEFKELWQFRDKLQSSDLKLNSTILPNINQDLMNEVAFKDLILEGEKLGANKDDNYKQIEIYNIPEDVSALEEIIEHLKQVLELKHITQNAGYKLIFNDMEAGGIREDRWRNFVNDIHKSNKELFNYYNALITHNVDLPNKDRLGIKEDLRILKERMESGKKLNLTFFLIKGKNAKYLTEQPILNGKALATLEDFEPVENYIKYQELKEETVRIFNGNMVEINHTGIEVDEERFPHILEERRKELENVITLFEGMNVLKSKLMINGISLFSIEDASLLLTSVEQAKVYLQYKQWLKSYHEELTKIKLYSDQNKAHPIIFELIAAFEKKDTNQWRILINKLLIMYETKKDVEQFYKILDKMNESLPLTKKSIELSMDDMWDYPNYYLESFELKKLRTWLDETKDINAARYRELIKSETNKQKMLIKEIVKDSTWKNQIQRITDKEKRALSAWKSYIKRFGKGTGKYAQQHLNGARAEMKNAQSAIPVWIMPVTQVLENFPITNEKFDVIIFDESSQCDVFTTNVLLRGKKMIVVGDDQQISPQAIGTKQDDVNELVRRYLQDIPNASLFDGNISLYEMAEQTFPKEGKLMLREHFRCVPEIIQFSNDLSYGGEMIPLRLPLEEEKLEPPVMAIKVDDGYNDEKDKDLNHPEAEAIVHDIYELVHDPKYINQSIGIITLQGNKQHKLLETLIRDKIGDREYVARKIICGNPYDLQGDERDIIFLSMVVAPNRNFRALTMQRDKQRYNVAASRAKNQMRLYHSVDTNQLNSNDFRHSLLSYCKNPTRVNKELEDLESLCDSPFEIEVLRMILAKGYKVTPQVKVGGYRIDLVVEGIRDRLAVECDGERWHGPEKFEEDMQRQGSLERSGWKFWRIRGREFYFNKKEAMESLWVKLAEMGIQPGDSDTIEVEPKNESKKLHPSVEDTQGSFVKEPNKDSPFRRDDIIIDQQMLFIDGTGSNQQIDLFEEENLNHNSDNKKDWLVDYLTSKNLNVIDKRQKGGSLWVLGGTNLGPALIQLKKKEVYFKYAATGSRATGRRSGWYTKYDDVID